MPYTPPVVKYAAWTSSTYYQLTNIQSINITRGRQFYQDNFSVSQAVIELIPATSYTLELAVGQYIDVRKSPGNDTSAAYFTGQITDVQRVYGIPYNSVTGAAPADRIVVTAVGTTGNLGTTQLEQPSFTSTLATTSALEIIEACNLRWPAALRITSPVTIAGNAYQGGAFDKLNKILRSLQFVFSEVDEQRAITAGQRLGQCYLHPPGQSWTTGDKWVFGTSGSYVKYNQIEYLSSVQNRFTKVVVESDTVADQTATVGDAPYNSVVYSSLSDSTSSAAALANYVLTVNQQTSPVPFRIVGDTAVDSTILDLCVLPVSPSKKSTIGRTVDVIFRGPPVKAVIQGFSVAFYPDIARVQVYMSPSLGQPFTLDNNSFGVLDQDRLGYP